MHIPFKEPSRIYMHILIPSTQCLLCSSSVTSLLAMGRMTWEELAALGAEVDRALLQPPLPVQSPPHMQDPNTDYCSLLLVDLKYDQPKGQIRAIFEQSGVSFGGQGPS